ncbi:hypothetical protein ACFVWT_04275 [Arthrobacter sp. NPDC058288]|uniref:hypothetical protein n=1 Tax=Arthrobacter sp. NPDC058288 TaxID=3346424 RepID=UPI0036EC629A
MSAMPVFLTKLRHALGRLTRTDWAFLHFKAALGFLLMIPLVQLNSVRDNTNQVFITIWFGVTLLGFCVSAIGIVMSAQKYETRRNGFRWEMAGLWLLLSGPLVFILLQAGLWITTGQQRIVTIALCYVIAAAILARMVMVKSAAKSRTVIFRYLDEEERGKHG